MESLKLQIANAVNTTFAENSVVDCGSRTVSTTDGKGKTTATKTVKIKVDLSGESLQRVIDWACANRVIAEQANLRKSIAKIENDSVYVIKTVDIKKVGVRQPKVVKIQDVKKSVEDGSLSIEEIESLLKAAKAKAKASK